MLKDLVGKSRVEGRPMAFEMAQLEVICKIIEGDHKNIPGRQQRQIFAQRSDLRDTPVQSWAQERFDQLIATIDRQSGRPSMQIPAFKPAVKTGDNPTAAPSP